MADDWSQEENEATVANYFSMLAAELRGDHYSKAAHRRALLKLLAGRTDAAVERKHMNISAVLRELGHPWIDGYKPYGNYQRLLADVVAARVLSDGALVSLVRSRVEAPAAAPDRVDPDSCWEDPPQPDPRPASVREYSGRDHEYVPVNRGVDYLAMEARNRSLGSAGEEFVVRFEAERLHRSGHRHLADRVEHVAATQGDGLGYDILSFEPDGRQRIIEVKTTSFGKRTPFYVSRNELACSVARPAEYHLYRLFEFRRNPRLFALSGSLDTVCHLEPHQFVGRVA